MLQKIAYPQLCIMEALTKESRDWRKGQRPGLENLKRKTLRREMDGREMDGRLQVTYLGSKDRGALGNSLGYLADIRCHNPKQMEHMSSKR